MQNLIWKRHRSNWITLNKTAINIVWFKRDLRFIDHEPLFSAQQQSLPILLIYFFEPSVMAYDDSDKRHWRFVYESLQEMQAKLKNQNSEIYIFHNESEIVFEELAKKYQINTVFSHQEIGNKITFDRDIAMQNFFAKNQIQWNFRRGRMAVPAQSSPVGQSTQPDAAAAATAREEGGAGMSRTPTLAAQSPAPWRRARGEKAVARSFCLRLHGRCQRRAAR